MSLSQVIRFPRGDTQILPFVVKEDGALKNIEGADIEWGLYRNGGEVVSLDTDGVAIQNRDDTGGTFEIKIESGVTRALPPGGYDEQVRIIDATGNQSTFDGDVRLQPTQS